MNPELITQIGAQSVPIASVNAMPILMLYLLPSLHLPMGILLFRQVGLLLTPRLTITGESALAMPAAVPLVMAFPGLLNRQIQAAMKMKKAGHCSMFIMSLGQEPKESI